MQTIDKVIGIVKHMPWTDVVKELDSIKEEEWQPVRKLAADYCYDRTMCKLLDIDYSNLNKQGAKRLELIAHYMIRNGGEKHE